MKLNCVSDGAMVGMAQAFAIPSAEVLDEARCLWDTEPERLPTGTAPSFPSLHSLQGFRSPNRVSQLPWLFPSPSLLGKSLRCHFFPPEKTQTPFASPKARCCCSQGPSGGPSEAIQIIYSQGPLVDFWHK